MTLKILEESSGLGEKFNNQFLIATCVASLGILSILIVKSSAVIFSSSVSLTY